MPNKHCIHYWLIETGYQETSRGVCKFCGEERTFLNVWPLDYSPRFIPDSLATGKIKKPRKVMVK